MNLRDATMADLPAIVEIYTSRSGSLGLKTVTAGAFAHNEPSLMLFGEFGFECWAYFRG